MHSNVATQLADVAESAHTLSALERLAITDFVCYRWIIFQPSGHNISERYFLLTMLQSMFQQTALVSKWTVTQGAFTTILMLWFSTRRVNYFFHPAMDVTMNVQFQHINKSSATNFANVSSFCSRMRLFCSRIHGWCIVSMFTHVSIECTQNAEW